MNPGDLRRTRRAKRRSYQSDSISHQSFAAKSLTPRLYCYLASTEIARTFQVFRRTRNERGILLVIDDEVAVLDGDALDAGGEAEFFVIFGGGDEALHG